MTFDQPKHPLVRRCLMQLVNEHGLRILEEAVAMRGLFWRKDGSSALLSGSLRREARALWRELHPGERPPRLTHAEFMARRPETKDPDATDAEVSSPSDKSL